MIVAASAPDIDTQTCNVINGGPGRLPVRVPETCRLAGPLRRACITLFFIFSFRRGCGLKLGPVPSFDRLRLASSRASTVPSTPSAWCTLHHVRLNLKIEARRPKLIVGRIVQPSLENAAKYVLGIGLVHFHTVVAYESVPHVTARQIIQTELPTALSLLTTYPMPLFVKLQADCPLPLGALPPPLRT